MAMYTTLPEMSDKVNRLYDLLAEAQKLAEELTADNMKNCTALIGRYADALAEERPLTLDERITEATRQSTAFYNVEKALEVAQSLISLTY